MTRSDLRHRGSFSNIETPINQIAARNLEVLRLRKERQQRNAKILKKILIGFFIVAALAVLWETQKSCEATSMVCVD